jgi:hypothetical protein
MLQLFLVVVLLSAGCATFGRQRLDYTSLANADRVEVRNLQNEVVANIVDARKVQYAAQFAIDRQDRWGDRLDPYVPSLTLYFYTQDRRIGGYGISSSLLIALPTQHGFRWRDVPENDISALVKALDVTMPERLP